MRLIDADELLEQMETLLKKRSEEARHCGYRGLTVTWNDAIFLIKDAPTIDTSKELFGTINVYMDTDEVIGRIQERGWGPVEHGHWIKIGEIDKDGNQYYQCSKCGKGEIHVPIIDVKYCWNCGARMYEEEQDEID